MSNFLQLAAKDYTPTEDENVITSIFSQYEIVIIQSLITSFGLDFLIQDQHGGDVDTIHNVRQIGHDERMKYKNERNQTAYENRGEYDSHEYHSHEGYLQRQRDIKRQKRDGTLADAYTGDQIGPHDGSDLDHVIAAKEIHDDRGRVLAGMNGADLANSPENLQATNPHTNRTKKADSMEDFLEKYGDEYTEEQKALMRSQDKKARAAYETKLARSYYTSRQFAADTAKAAGKVGAKMGLRQAVGLVFAEMWFAVKTEFERLDVHFGLNMDLGYFFTAIGNGLKNGYDAAKKNYKQIFSQFIEGSVSGVLSSLTTTICNIFFTTAQNTVKIIRESFASVTEAAKILLFNPDCLLFGERMRAALKVLAAGASIVAGTLLAEALNATPLGAIPEIGGIIRTFCGTLFSGILSCTLLLYLDHSPLLNKIISMLNQIPSMANQVQYYKRQAAEFEKYAAELMQIDLARFRKETNAYASAAQVIGQARSDEELNRLLHDIFGKAGIKTPWDNYDSFDDFMNDPNGVMVFQ